MYRTIVWTAVLATAFAACSAESGPASTPEETLKKAGGPASTPEETLEKAGGPASTPEETFQRMQDAIGSKDWLALMDFAPPSKLPEAEAKFKMGLEDPTGLNMMAGLMGVKPEELKTMDYRTAMARIFEAMSRRDPKETEQIVVATIKETKIDGRNATLIVTRGEGTEEIKLVQEDGLWYMQDFN